MDAPRMHAKATGLESEILSVVNVESDEIPDGMHGPLKRSESTLCSEHSYDSVQRPARTSVFVDPEAMKAKLRKSMSKPEYDVADFYHKDGWCQLVARSSLFQNVTLSVIAFNALWLAIDTDMNGAAITLTAHPVFQIAEHGFCIYFFWEWIMRFFAFKRKRDGLRDAWFVFDSVLVFMMVAETWLMSIVILAMGGVSGGGLGGNTGTLRLLRLLRLSRMARMAKLLRSFPELLILIKGMASAMRSVIVTLLLLLLLIYVYSIMFRQLLEGSAAGQRYFPDMWVAIHTLWIDGTLLDSPGSLVALLLEESIVYVLIFYSFVLLAALAVMNMLIGVLCEVVSAVASTEREQIMMSTVKDGFMEIIRRGGLDTDGDNMISREEFVAILDDPDAVKMLMQVDVDPYAFVDLADFLFEEEDGQEARQMTFPEFMETVLSLRGTNNATVKDVVDLRKFIKSQFSSMEGKNRVRQSLVTRSIREQSHVVPPVVGIRPSGTAHSCSSTCCTPGPPQLWLHVAEMQSVLATAKSKLDHFLHAIPSPPGTAAACQRGSPGSPPTPGFCRAVSGGSNSMMTFGHQRSGSLATATTAATGAAAASLEVHPLTLPGMVRGAAGACPEDGSEAWVFEVVEGSHRWCEEPMSLPARLAEVRAHFQQLGQSLDVGVDELRSLQAML